MRRFSDFSVGREMSGHSFPKSLSVDELRRRLSAGVVRFTSSVSGDILKCRKKPSNSRRVSWSLASTEISDADFPSHTFGNCLIRPKQGDVLSGDKIIRKLSDETETIQAAGTETGINLDSNINTNDEIRWDKGTNLDKIVDSESDYDSEISGYLANCDVDPLSGAVNADSLCMGAVTTGSSLKKTKPILADVTRQSSEEDMKDKIVPKYVDELERDIMLRNKHKNKPENSPVQRRLSSGKSKTLNPSDDALVLQQTEEPIYVNMYEERNKKWSILDNLSDPVKTYLSLHLSIGEHLDELDASESCFPRRQEPHLSSSNEQDEMIYVDSGIKRKVSEGSMPRKKSESLIRTVLKDSITRKISEGSRRGTSGRKISREKNLEDVSGKLLDLKTLRRNKDRKMSDINALTIGEPIYANIPVNMGADILPYRQMKYAPMPCLDDEPGKATGMASELSVDKDIVTRKMSEGILPRKLSENLIKPLIQHSMKRKLSVDKAYRPYRYHGPFQMEMKALAMKGKSTDGLDAPKEPQLNKQYVNRSDSYHGQFKMEINPNANSSSSFEGSKESKLSDTKQGLRTQMKANRSIVSDIPREDKQTAVIRDGPKLVTLPSSRGPSARELIYRRDFVTRQPLECRSSPLTRKSYERMDRPVANDLITRNWPTTRGDTKFRSISLGCGLPRNSCVREARPVVEDLSSRDWCGGRSKNRVKSVSGECRTSRSSPERMTSPVVSDYERMMSPVGTDFCTRELSRDRSRSRIRTFAGETRMYRNSSEREGDYNRMMRSVVDDFSKLDWSVDRSDARFISDSSECRVSKNFYERSPKIGEQKSRHPPSYRDTSRTRIKSASRDDKLSRNCYERMNRPKVDTYIFNASDLPGNGSETRSRSLSGEGRLCRGNSQRMFPPVFDDLSSRGFPCDRSRNRIRSDSGDHKVVKTSYERKARPLIDNIAFRQMSRAHEYGDRVRSVSEEVCRGKVSVKDLIRAFSGELETATRYRESVPRSPTGHSSTVSPKGSSPLRGRKFEKSKKVTGSPRSSSLSPCLRKKKKSVVFMLENSPESECIKSPTGKKRFETHVTPVLDRRCRQLSGEARKRKTGLGSVPPKSEAEYLDMQSPARFPTLQTNQEKNEWLTRKSGPGWESPRILRNRKISEGAFLRLSPQRALIRTMSGTSLIDR